LQSPKITAMTFILVKATIKIIITPKIKIVVLKILISGKEREKP
jgi:hypothetical protein